MGKKETKKVVLRYFQSWQQQDWVAFREALADDVDVEPFGNHTFASADAFTEFCKQGPAWRDVELLDSLYGPDKAALLYEGTSTAEHGRVRVGEFVDVQDGKVVRLRAAIAMRA